MKELSMKKESQHPPKTAVKPKPPPAPPKRKTLPVPKIHIIIEHQVQEGD
jgi:hypothetical protein